MTKVLSIITDPKAEVLQSHATEIELIDDEIRALAEVMIVTMRAQKGAGLAAPQVGVSKCMIICDLDKVTTVMINPVITSFSKTTDIDEEGCLSLPGLWLDVERSQEITVEFLDLTGTKQTLNLTKFSARVVQHEIDHLNGILMTDRNRQLKHPVVL